MKLSNIAVNVENIEHGEWVDDIPEMENLRLRVRGIDNGDWKRLRSKHMDAIPRQWRAGKRADEIDRIISICLRDAGLIDWEGLTDDEDKPIMYSRDMANKLLTEPQYRKFRDAVLWAATVVGETNHVKVEEQEKN